MSLQIKNDHLFTEFERKYLIDRGQEALVKENKKEFASSEKKVSSKELDLSDEVVSYIKSRNENQIKEQLRSSSVSFEEDEPLRNLKFKLAQYLQEKRDADSDS